MSLTDTVLKALKPKDASYIVSDDRGLYVEVLPSGSIVWRYRYRLDGKREKLTLGKYPALTLKNARLKRDEAAHQVAMGESPAKRKQQEKVAGAEDATVRKALPVGRAAHRTSLGCAWDGSIRRTGSALAGTCAIEATV